MKSTGVTRNLDNLGRVVLPIELRRTLNIDIKDPLEVFIDDNKLILKKYNPGCVICESMDIAREFKGQRICKNCIDGLKK
jgi:AbrB family transcriptional regulator, transcriptional pleiotropic regulator of transition state genes